MNVTMRVLHLAGYPSNDVEASLNRSALVVIRAQEPIKSRRQKFDQFISNRSALVVIRAQEPIKSRRQKFDQFISACEREANRCLRGAHTSHLRAL